VEPFNEMPSLNDAFSDIGIFTSDELLRVNVCEIFLSFTKLDFALNFNGFSCGITMDIVLLNIFSEEFPAVDITRSGSWPLLCDENEGAFELLLS